MPNINTFTDYSAEQQDIERRRKMAEMLSQQGMQPVEQQTAGGMVVPTSWTQGLAKALQAGLGGYQQGQLRDEQKGLGAKMRSEASDWLSGMPQATTRDLNPVAMDDEGNAMPTAMQTTQPSQQQMMAWALKGGVSGNPLASQMAAPFMAQALKANDPYSLREGEKRYGANGQVIATNEKPLPGFSLSPGQQRFTGTGAQVASLPESYTMSPGQVRVSGGEQVAAVTDPNKPFNADGSPNKAYQGYELGKANAGATRVQTNVNAFTPASEEAQRDFMKSSRTTYDQLKQAPVAIQSIEQAKALIPAAKGFMGPGGETLLDAAKFLNNRVGTSINVEGVKNAEELRTRIFFNIMDNLKKMDAQPSQQQQVIMQEALGKLGTDPNALPRVLDAFADVMRGKVELHNDEVTRASARGVKFPYDPVIKMPGSKSQSSGVPSGVDPKVWSVMTPQEKALFQ